MIERKKGDQLATGRSVDFTSAVRRIRSSASDKVLILKNGASITVHRFCCVGVDDQLRVSRRGGRLSIEAICHNGRAVVLPAFRMSRPLEGTAGRLVIHEATRADDLAGFEALSHYHYRAHVSFGRRAVLVAHLETNGHRELVGYIEITNSFQGHKSRNDLLNAPFSDSSGVHWDKWNLKSRARYLNVIARISRCVVHPEFRGVGIGVAMCVAAGSYCRSHWHIARLRPLFLEITADMLKYVPFAEKAGMTLIGSTSGNIGRVRKDQSYLHKVSEEIRSGTRDRESHAVFSGKAKSILAKQRADVARVREIADSQGLKVDQMLKVYLSSDTPEGMSPTAYDLLSDLLRFPKPTYMSGLSADAAAFLSERLAQRLPQVVKAAMEPRASITAPIQVRDLSIKYSYAVPASGWANAIREAFGLGKEVLTHTGVSNLSLVVNPREILYVWGPSGSGKTGFVDVLAGIRKPSGGDILGLKRGAVAVFDLSFADLPIVELLGGSDLASSLFSLNYAGLSEASLYFKKPSMLSAGQRHRLAIARLISSRAPVWIVDEFCSVLDDTTAAIVARNVGRVARQLGVTAIIAGPRQDPVIAGLAPDIVLSLSSLGTYRIEMRRPDRRGL